MTRQPFTVTLTALRRPARESAPTTVSHPGRRPTRAVQARRAATIATMTAEGITTWAIARHLGIGVRTVTAYRARLRETT